MAETQFLNDTEEKTFIEEWEKTRREVLEHLNGKIIILAEGSKEYNKDYGFINRSRSAASN